MLARPPKLHCIYIYIYNVHTRIIYRVVYYYCTGITLLLCRLYYTWGYILWGVYSRWSVTYTSVVQRPVTVNLDIQSDSFFFFLTNECEVRNQVKYVLTHENLQYLQTNLWYKFV